MNALKKKREILTQELIELDTYEDAEEIEKTLKTIERIDNILERKRSKVSADVIAKGCFYLAGIGVVMLIEKTGVLNPRAASFMLKGSNIL